MKDLERTQLMERYGITEDMVNDYMKQWSKSDAAKGISQIIINHINAGNLKLNGICVNDLVNDLVENIQSK